MIIKHTQILLCSIICSFSELNLNPILLNLFPDFIIRQKIAVALAVIFTIGNYLEIFEYYLIIKIAGNKKVRFKDYFNHIASMFGISLLIINVLNIVLLHISANGVILKLPRILFIIIMSWHTYNYLGKINTDEKKKNITIVVFFIITIMLSLLTQFIQKYVL